MARPRSFFLVGLLLGGLLGAGVVFAATPAQSGVSVPSMSSTAATGCSDTPEPRAWVGQTGAPEYRSIEFQNFTFTHDDPNLGVRANLTEQTAGRWVLDFTTQPETPEKTGELPCPPRTTLSASVALPTDFETLTIRLDDEPVTTVENSGARPDFYYLNATGGT